jgi:hypothetical protein
VGCARWERPQLSPLHNPPSMTSIGRSASRHARNIFNAHLDGIRLLEIEYCLLPVYGIMPISSRHVHRNSANVRVYFACGPVENFTGLCAALKEISNHANRAWTTTPIKMSSFDSSASRNRLTVLPSDIQFKRGSECELIFLHSL